MKEISFSEHGGFAHIALAELGDDLIFDRRLAHMCLVNHLVYLAPILPRRMMVMNLMPKMSGPVVNLRVNTRVRRRSPGRVKETFSAGSSTPTILACAEPWHESRNGRVANRHVVNLHVEVDARSGFSIADKEGGTSNHVQLSTGLQPSPVEPASRQGSV